MSTLANVGPMGPITPHGTVVVNVAFDSNLYAQKKSSKKSEWLHRNDSDSIVVKGDLVFRYKDGCKRKRVSYNEPDLKVFSTVNGIPEKAHMGEYRDLVSFIGVSNGDLVPGPSKHTSATVAGLMTIKNTGPLPISAGDKIVWDFPNTKDRRYKTVGRRPFVTLPYRNALSESVDSFAKLVNDNKEKSDEELKEVDPSVSVCAKAIKNDGVTEKTIKCLIEASKELDSRVVGIALSDAGAGDTMDVLIRYGK